MTVMSEDQLIGEHTEVLDRLLEEYGRIRKGEPGPSAFVLKAPSGYGKSRIIREFYERVRNPVEGKPYWPSLAREKREDTRAFGVDPLPDRKVLGPDLNKFIWEAGALPQFGWWSFNCELMATGQPMDLVSAATPQLTSHSVPLRIAQNHSLGVKGKLTGPVLSKFIQGFHDAVNGEANGEISELIEEVVGSVPGLGIWVDMSAWGITAARQGLTRKRRLRGQIDVGSEVRAAANEKGRELADLVFDLSAPGLPAIVVIEDVHRLSEEFLDFLQALHVSDPERPLMVIATAWPEAVNNAAYSQWIAEGTAAKNLIEVPVPGLGQPEVARIIRSFSPDLISVESSLALAARMKTPYIAKLWMTTPSVERELAAAALSASDPRASVALCDKLLSMPVPRDIKEVYENRWRELPPRVREALVLATNASTTEERLARFVPQVVARAAELIGQNRDSTRDALEDAIEPHSWCVMDGAAEVLREELMTQVAREGREMVSVTDAQLAKFRDHISQASASLLAERAGDERQGSATEESRLLMAQSVLEQHGSRRKETAETVSARRILATAAISSAEDSRAATILKPVLGWIDAETTALGLACLGLYAESVAPKDIRSAVESSSRRVSGAFSVYGEVAPEYWDILIEDLELRTMSAFGSAGKSPDVEAISEVLQDHRRLISDVALKLGSGSEQHLLASQNYAMTLLDAGDRVAAVEAFRSFLVPMEHKFGAQDYRTLNAKTDFVMATGRDASSTEMLPFVQNLLRDLRAVFGDTDFRTIDVRRQEIFWRLRTPAQREGLLPMIEDLIVDSSTYRGPSSFAALNARAARSIYFSRSDMQERGVQEAEQLVDRAREIFGPRSGAYYYFNQIFKNAQGRAQPAEPALGGKMRLRNVATASGEGWEPLSAETIMQARALYADLEGAPPEPTSEAMRSKLMKEFLASEDAKEPGSVTAVKPVQPSPGPDTGVKPPSPATAMKPAQSSPAPGNRVKPVQPFPGPDTGVKPRPSAAAVKPVQSSPGPDTQVRPRPSATAEVPAPKGHVRTSKATESAPQATSDATLTKKPKPGILLRAALVAAALAFAFFLLLTPEGASLPNGTVFAVAGLLALLSSAHQKLKPFLMVSVLVAIGLLSAVPGFPGSSAAEAGVNWFALGAGAGGPFAFVLMRRLQSRNLAAAKDAAARGRNSRRS